MKALTKQKLLTIVGMVVGLFIARVQPGMPLWTTLAMIGVLVIIPVFAILISSKYSSRIIKFGVLILGGGLVVSLLLILFDGIPNVGWGAFGWLIIPAAVAVWWPFPAARRLWKKAQGVRGRGERISRRKDRWNNCKSVIPR